MPRIHFQQQLAELKDKLLAMAALAQRAVEAAAEAYLRRDPLLCQSVREDETAINLAQRQIDVMAYELLAQEQPMAIDLRFILAVIKINGDLERIGDQSMSIAIRTMDLLEYPPVDLPVDVRRMAGHASQMIRAAIETLIHADAQAADSVLAMDDVIDHMNRESYRKLMLLMPDRPEITLQALHAMIIARNLERIADHATNIAKDVIFWIRGADAQRPLNATAE